MDRTRQDGTDRTGRDWVTRLFALTTELLVIQRIDDGRPEFVSPSCEQVLGYRPEELPHRWSEVIHPDDVATVLETRNHVAAVPKAEARLRVRATHADGRLRHLELSIVNHADDDLIGGLLLRARDITDMVETEVELARSHARFAAIVTKGPGATVLLDAEGVITFASEGIQDLLGLEPDRLVGRLAFDLIHPDDHEAAVGHLDSLRDCPDGPDARLRVRAGDGAYHWIGVSGVNQLDDPALASFVLELRDEDDRALVDQRMARLLAESSGAIYVVDDEGAITWATPGVERFLGPHRRIDDDVVAELVGAGEADAMRQAYRRILDGGPGTVARVVARLGPDAHKPWVDMVLTNAQDDPSVDGIIVNVRDVDEAVRAGDTGNRLAEVLENTTDVVTIYDGELNRIWSNASAVALFGPSPTPAAEVIDHLADADAARLRTELLPALERHGSWRGELTVRAAHGAELPIEATVLLHASAEGDRYYSLMARDISERKRLESRLQAKARHDQLTGLPNRLFLAEKLEASLARGDRLGVLFLDLDQFKTVNDTQGHDAGDQLLVMAAERLRGALRPTDLVARFGGDEFVVLLPEVTTAEEALPMAERILDHLRGPAQLGEMQVYLTGSAGIAIADGVDATTLISNADAAMYKAKARGRDRVALFTAELRDRSQARLETAQKLRSAIDANQLDVWFQPIVDTATGQPIAVEALARWRHPDLGEVRTEEMIAVAEETGLILALGSAVIDRTCDSIAALGDAVEPLTFSVNLSAHQLADPRLTETLERAMLRTGVRPQQLLCEVTESAVMLDVDHSVEVLDRIRALGIRLAIDDFGTGYSSLAYLQRFPVDVLKIDREFVTDLRFESEWKRSLAAGIISLAHSLGLRVVAEGVETSEQAEVLEMLGCDALQGFLYAVPVPHDLLVSELAHLRSGRRRG